MKLNTTHHGDSLQLVKKLEPNSIDLIFTSPPYFDLHQYTDSSAEIGYNQTLEKYLGDLETLFESAKTSLKPHGNLVINISDLVRKNKPLALSNMLIDRLSYNYVQRIVWSITNKMPVASDVRFCNKFEWILHWSKNDTYYFDKDSVREPHSHYAAKDKRVWKWNSKGKCPGNIWTIPAYRVQGKNKLHQAAFPIQLAERVVKAWCPENGVTLDPFMGSGTTAVACVNTERNFLGFELSEKYCNASNERIKTLNSDNIAII